MTYRNTSGTTAHGGAAGDNSTYWTGDDVGAGSFALLAQHQFSFADCAADCSITLTTAPK